MALVDEKQLKTIMKTKSIIVIMALSIVSIIFMKSCNSAAENVEKAEQDVLEANEALALANEELQADIDNYCLETNAKITQNDSIIQLYKNSKKEYEKSGEDAFDEEIEDLEQRNRELESKIHEYDGTSEGKEKWEKFKEEFNHDMEELGAALKDLSVNNIDDKKSK